MILPQSLNLRLKKAATPELLKQVKAYKESIWRCNKFCWLAYHKEEFERHQRAVLQELAERN